MAASFSAITQYPDHHFLCEIFTTPWKHIVTRPTWTNVAGRFEHTFEHTLNDLRTESQDVTLSQGGVGTTRFQILRRWQSERYTRVHGPQAFVLENTRADSIWPEAWMKLPEKQKNKIRLPNGKKRMLSCPKLGHKRGIYEVSTEDRDYFRANAQRHIT